MSAACRLCGRDVVEVLDLGPQPYSNRYPRVGETEQDSHPFVLGACSSCGLAQLIEPAPEEELVPREDWIAYREPDAHLPEVADSVAALSGIGRGSRVRSSGEYDEPLVQELSTRGLVPDEGAKADVSLYRYRLEHARDLRLVLAALHEGLADGGYLVLEVPDCEPAFAQRDYSFLWEEHTLYFVEATLAAALEAEGFDVVACFRPAAVDALVVTARAVDARAAPAEGADAFALAQAFGAALEDVRAGWRGRLERATADGRRAGLFGAGHACAMFVNALQLEPRFALVLDDHPPKQGRALPGTAIPIVPSERLTELDLCVLTTAPDVQESIAQANEDWVAAGGEFWSISPGSQRHPFAPAAGAA